MWTVLDAKRGRRTRYKKEGEHQPSSLKVLAVSTEPLRGLGISLIRHSPEKGTLHQGRLESTRSLSDEYSKA